MRAAQPPHHKCGGSVPAGVMMYYCELAQNHYGPCATFSSKESVQTRVNWEEHNPDKKYTVRDTTIIASTNEGK